MRRTGPADPVHFSEMTLDVLLDLLAKLTFCALSADQRERLKIWVA